MACISISEFAKKHNLKIRTVYNLLYNNKHLKKRVKGLGVLIDEAKYEKLVG